MNLNLVIVILVLLAFYLVATYNGLVVLRTRIKEAFSGIDVQLKRRADLIPNVVETVKGYAKHEKGIFENVAKARASLMSAKTTKDKAVANNQLTETLKSLFAIAEAYPNLKANANFQDLQRQLEDTEDKVAYSRQFYNSNVLEYNTKIKVFPTNLFASSLGFTKEEFFEANENERKNVKVNFNN